MRAQVPPAQTGTPHSSRWLPRSRLPAGPASSPAGIPGPPSTHAVVALSGGYWKYPLISRIRWLDWVVNAVTSPLAPAGTSAAFPVIAPSPAFNVATKGLTPPPHNVRYPRIVTGTTVA